MGNIVSLLVYNNLPFCLGGSIHLCNNSSSMCFSIPQCDPPQSSLTMVADTLDGPGV